MSGAGEAAGAPREARIGIINVSDRAAAGVYEDLPGKAVVAALGEYLVSPWSSEYRIIADERDQLTAAMIEMADAKGCCLIVTTGGTGPALRDVTPEATADACEKMLPGFGVRSSSGRGMLPETPDSATPPALASPPRLRRT